MYPTTSKFPDLSTIAYNHLLNHFGRIRSEAEILCNQFSAIEAQPPLPTHPDFMEDVPTLTRCLCIMLSLNGIGCSGVAAVAHQRIFGFTYVSIPK